MTRVGRPTSSGRADAGRRLGQVLMVDRDRAGMTRAALAIRARVALNTVMAIEQGRVADPGFFTVTALARGLGMSSDELLRRIQQQRSAYGIDHDVSSGEGMTRGLISIGYEGRDLVDLVAELQRTGADILIDVRLNAISRRPGFSKTALNRALTEAGIEYRHFRDLGNRKENRPGFQQKTDSPGRQSFRTGLSEPRARDQLDALAELASTRVVAVFCVERDEETCHRQIVIEAVRALDIAVPVLAAT
jgi:transcriptional regulator with XRE-family HTH domain